MNESHAWHVSHQMRDVHKSMHGMYRMTCVMIHAMRDMHYTHDLRNMHGIHDMHEMYGAYEMQDMCDYG